MNNFVKRTLSGAVFVAVTVGAILGGGYFSIPLFLFFALGTLWEFYRLIWKPEQRPHDLISIGIMAGVLFYLGCVFDAALEKLQLNCFWDTEINYLLSRTCFLLAIVFLFLVGGLLVVKSKRESPFADWGKTVLGIFYVILPFSLVPRLALMSSQIPSRWLLLLPLLFTWVNDTGAYCVGSLLGKHKLIPSVSPGKSVEGFIGGLFFCMLLGGFFFVIMSNQLQNKEMVAISGGICGILVALAAVLGDLVESRLKRSLGVKDSGVFLPGHGGFLDRFDSLLFTLPMMWNLFSIIN